MGPTKYMYPTPSPDDGVASFRKVVFLKILDDGQSPETQLIQRIYLLTYLRSWALHKKLPIVQPLRNFPAF
jgi:hypothetical protein